MKLNIKVIAAVLGLVTMAAMLVACTTEVIKEVPVEQVVTETVVKEVPVEVVVEKEVVKEVPVQRVVEVEVIKEVEVPVEKVVEKEVVRELERPVVVERKWSERWKCSKWSQWRRLRPEKRRRWCSPSRSS